MEETGVNLFLTGRAGTGKTTFLKKLRDKSRKRIVVLAPTGVAAINARGVTLHSFFQLSFGPYIPGKGFAGEGGEKARYRMSREKRRLIASLDMVVIDEVSMVRPDLLDATDAVLRRFRDPTRPFGGVQLLLIGDLRQLAPVINEKEWAILSPYYSSPYFFDSHALKEAGYAVIELKKVYRQSDREFIEMLNKVRDGRVDFETMRRLNSRYIPGFKPDDKDGYIHLTTHNAIANEINEKRLAVLPGPELSYEAEVKDEFPEYAFPAEKTLKLKAGAQVMFIKNDKGEDRRFYNGMIGTVTGLGANFINVMPAGGNEVITVERVTWENTKYVTDDAGEIKELTVGSFTQYPLRTAWAITIHKSQGLTFDKAIIDASHSFAPGQTYVALSRCRSLEGIVLSSPLSSSAMITDSRITSYTGQCDEMKPDKDSFIAMRNNYWRSQLADIFDFHTLCLLFKTLYRALEEYVIPMYPQFKQHYAGAKEIFENQIEEVGRKFTALYASEATDADACAHHRPLLDKIKSGCRYFVSKLTEVDRIIMKYDILLDNKDYQRRVLNAMEAFYYRLDLRVEILKLLSEVDFSPENYARCKSKALLTLENPQKKKKEEKEQKPIKAQKEVKEEKKPRKPKGYSSYESLKKWREGKSVEQIAQERDLKTSTIAGHFADRILMGDAGISEFINDDDILALRRSIEDDMSENYLALYEQTKDLGLPSWQIYLFYRVAVQNNKKD